MTTYDPQVNILFNQSYSAIVRLVDSASLRFSTRVERLVTQDPICDQNCQYSKNNTLLFIHSKIFHQIHAGENVSHHSNPDTLSAPRDHKSLESQHEEMKRRLEECTSQLETYKEYFQNSESQMAETDKIFDEFQKKHNNCENERISRYVPFKSWYLEKIFMRCTVK